MLKTDLEKLAEQFAEKTSLRTTIWAFVGIKGELYARRLVEDRVNSNDSTNEIVRLFSAIFNISMTTEHFLRGKDFLNEQGLLTDMGRGIWQMCILMAVFIKTHAEEFKVFQPALATIDQLLASEQIKELFSIT